MTSRMPSPLADAAAGIHAAGRWPSTSHGEMQPGLPFSRGQRIFSATMARMASGKYADVGDAGTGSGRASPRW